jgi:hypothetical protein
MMMTLESGIRIWNSSSISIAALTYEEKIVMTESDWNAEAEAMAQEIAQIRSQVPRGAVPGRHARVSIVFGNGPDMDPASVQDEVSRTRDALDQAGIRILGFGVDPGNAQTWAMIVESEDVPMLNDLVGAL